MRQTREEINRRDARQHALEVRTPVTLEDATEIVLFRDEQSRREMSEGATKLLTDLGKLLAKLDQQLRDTGRGR